MKKLVLSLTFVVSLFLAHKLVGMELEKLPDTVLMQILSKTHPRDAAKISQASKYLKEIADNKYTKIMTMANFLTEETGNPILEIVECASNDLQSITINNKNIQVDVKALIRVLSGKACIKAENIYPLNESPLSPLYHEKSPLDLALEKEATELEQFLRYLEAKQTYFIENNRNHTGLGFSSVIYKIKQLIENDKTKHPVFSLHLVNCNLSPTVIRVQREPQEIDLDKIACIDDRIKNIEELYITKCFLKEIPNGLTSFPKLKKVVFARNPLSEADLTLLMENNNLEVVKLIDCQISHLPTEIENMPNLKEIDLAFNDLDQESLNLIEKLKEQGITVSNEA